MRSSEYGAHRIVVVQKRCDNRFTRRALMERPLKRNVVRGELRVGVRTEVGVRARARQVLIGADRGDLFDQTERSTGHRRWREQQWSADAEHVANQIDKRQVYLVKAIPRYLSRADPINQFSAARPPVPSRPVSPADRVGQDLLPTLGCVHGVDRGPDRFV